MLSILCRLGTVAAMFVSLTFGARADERFVVGKAPTGYLMLSGAASIKLKRRVSIASMGSTSSFRRVVRSSTTPSCLLPVSSTA